MRTLEAIKTAQAEARDKIQKLMFRSNTVRTLSLRIEPDVNPENPREWDNSTVLCLAHNRYDLPNETPIDPTGFDGWDEVEAELVRELAPLYICPVYMHDHGFSGLTLSTTPFSCRWDSGQVGFALVLPAEGVTEEHCAEAVAQEVNTYSQYLEGEVYGYIVEDEEGTHIDSCWGYFGYDYCKKEGEEAMKHLSF